MIVLKRPSCLSFGPARSESIVLCFLVSLDQEIRCHLRGSWEGHQEFKELKPRFGIE